MTDSKKLEIYYRDRGKRQLLIGFALILIVLGGLGFWKMINCGKVDSSRSINLLSVLPSGAREQMVVGNLLQDIGFKNFLSKTNLYGIWKGQSIDLFELSQPNLTRKTLYETNGNFITQVCGGSDLLVFVETGDFGERLRCLADQNNPKTIYSEFQAKDGRPARQIISLSLSPSRKLLAFLISGSHNWADWRDHSLMIHDFEKNKTHEIWQGNVRKPQGSMLGWFQPLPWSPDSSKVLLCNSSMTNLAIDVRSGNVEEICKGYLPVGYVEKKAILLLKELGWGTTSRNWVLQKLDLKTDSTTDIMVIKGPVDIGNPIVYKGNRFASFVVEIYPDGKVQKGNHQYTLFIDLMGTKYALIKANISSWTKK